MKRIILFYCLTLLPFVAGFSQETDKNKTCVYSYDHGNTKFGWKAFKFTEKTGVGGSFDKIEVVGTTTGNSFENTFKGMKFTIDPNTVNSGNNDRDAKIKSAFFYPMRKERKNRRKGNFCRVKFRQNFRERNYRTYVERCSKKNRLKFHSTKWNSIRRDNKFKFGRF
ncbi:YceI-like domain protein [Leptospira interrogans serovar Copenhageni str. LT2050]|uniref:YceI-like domain protein n=1 Tax=Leptospira interrogans serovar Copenhageni str. LT2050 TaxID=1001598 RepID=M3G9P2_LEPIT|nr:YceI-like domain protein [Leptospira interrogans serovar Copenhageni str. LT2050]